MSAVAMASAQSRGSTDAALKQLTHDVSIIKDSQAELRRDQLNYKIEKEILKESYASSLQTVNMAITFILGLLAVLGYLGIRDIGSMKKEYSDDLEKLGTLRKQLEERLNKLTLEQQSVREELTSILQVNREQDQRIKLLELQEKAGTLMQQRSFARALDYIDAGLEIDQDNFILLNQKALCLLKTGKPNDAVQAFSELLSANQDHPQLASIVANLAEGYLILYQVDRYELLRAEYAEVIASYYEGAAIAFLDSFKATIQADADAVRSVLTAFVDKLPSPQQKPWMAGWDFSDSNSIVALSSNESAKKAFAQGVAFFSGAIGSQQLLDNLGAICANK